MAYTTFAGIEEICDCFESMLHNTILNAEEGFESIQHNNILNVKEGFESIPHNIILKAEESFESMLHNIILNAEEGFESMLLNISKIKNDIQIFYKLLYIERLHVDTECLTYLLKSLFYK